MNMIRRYYIVVLLSSWKQQCSQTFLTPLNLSTQQWSSEEQLSAFLKKGWTRLSLQLATIGIATRVPLKCSPQLSNSCKTGHDAIDKGGLTDTLLFSYWRFLLLRTWLTSCSRCRSTLATIYCRSGQPCVILFWHSACLCNNFTGLLLSTIGAAV